VTDLRTQLQATLGDNYTLQRELGGGGMSRVFLATETALGRDVVIKVISPEVMGDAGADRFAREVKLAARLQHANIVPVLTAGDANGLAYYTMPMVRGETVRERLQRGAVPPAESRAMLRDIARALAYAHGEGIVHRDVKPENVLLSGDAALVADFGIAKAIALSKTEAPGGTLTQMGTSLGTPAYMAPEQAAGDEVDARADLYAWGVMAYELLTSKHPFADKTTGQQLIAAHIAEKPKPLLDVLTADARRDVNVRALAPLVMQCLEKQPAARPANARVVLDALEKPVAAPSGAVRGRMMAIGAAALVVVAAVMWFAMLRSADTAATPMYEPKRVVVATFENKSGDRSLDPLGVMAADWIARGLVGTGLVDVGGTAADLQARGVAMGSAGTESAVQGLARAANAGIVVSGAFYKQGDSVLFQADFTDANAAKLVQSVGPVSALAASPLTGVELLRQRVVGALAPLVDPMLATFASQTRQPPSVEAYRELLAGEASFYTNEPEAMDRYRRAAQMDSAYVFPLLRFGLVASNMEDTPRYDSALAVLRPRRARMTPYEQAYFDYVACTASVDKERCVTATREMVRLSPKSQNAAYLYGVTLRTANRPRTADSVLRLLDPKSGELAGRLYIYEHEGSTLHTLGEYQRELEYMRLGSAQYPNRQLLAPLIIRAYVALGKLRDADSIMTVALSLPTDLRESATTTAVFAVYELRWHGHASEADAMAARVLAWMGTRPAAERASREKRVRRAELLMASHRWNDLQAIADSLVAERLTNTSALPYALMLQGIALAKRGHRAEAEAVIAKIATLGGPSADVARCFTGSMGRCGEWYRAGIAAALGDDARAVSLLPPGFGTTGTAHRHVIGEMLQHYAPFQELIKPRGCWRFRKSRGDHAQIAGADHGPPEHRTRIDSQYSKGILNIPSCRPDETMDFEFDDAKSRSNKQKHGIDFLDAERLWLDDRLLEVQARTGDEPRFVVIGRIAGVCWSAVITYRGGRVRLISVRRSRTEEVALYES